MSFFKKLKNVASAVSTVTSVTNALSSNNPVGTLASNAINRATRGNTTLSQLNNISQFRNSSLGSIVNGSLMNSSNRSGCSKKIDNNKPSVMFILGSVLTISLALTFSWVPLNKSSLDKLVNDDNFSSSNFL